MHEDTALSAGEGAITFPLGQQGAPAFRGRKGDCDMGSRENLQSVLQTRSHAVNLSIFNSTQRATTFSLGLTSHLEGCQWILDVVNLKVC